ncbi:hypothetical protein [Rhodococcus sp. ARC_M6]
MMSHRTSGKDRNGRMTAVLLTIPAWTGRR